MLLTKISIILGSALICAVNVPFEQTKVVDYKEETQSEVFYHRNMLHSEMLNNYTKVNYKYETNDIDYTSLQTFEDSFVDGNIYNFYLDTASYSNGWFSYFLLCYTNIFDIHIGVDLNNAYSTYQVTYTNNVGTFECDDAFYFSYNTPYDTFSNIDDFIYLQTDFYFPMYDERPYLNYITFDFVYSSVDGSLENLYAFYIGNPISRRISASSYNEILSVEYVQPQTIVGVINEFCENYLFSEIPYVNQLKFSVGGQEINLMTYLIILVGIGLGIVLLWLLFLLFKWLFLLFAGMFKSK